jgi:hypothetical protein
MIRRSAFLTALLLAGLLLAAPSQAAEEPPCELTPKELCYGLAYVEGSLSTTQAGAHPDVSITFDIEKDPESEVQANGLKVPYGKTSSVRVELPPGLIGNPNVLGAPQQCTTVEFFSWEDPDAGCPNGSQIGVAEIAVDEFSLREPLYMMQPPGGEVIARLGLIGAIYPFFIDISVRSESDYGIVSDLVAAPSVAKLNRVKTTFWGVPSDASHDHERCTAFEAWVEHCFSSPARPPGSRPLPFWTNPTRCGVPLEVRVGAASWAEPDRLDFESAPMGTISGCNRLPFGPDLVFEPTSHAAGQPTGADITIRLPASDGVEVLEPSQIREIRVTLPEGMAFNPGAADGLTTCSEAQVHYGQRVSSECPDSAKLAGTEFDVGAFPRKIRGAVYLREPEPGHLFRIWIVADDLGAHVKLKGELEVDPATGRITEVTTDIPQAPTREVKLLFKSGLRAPLLNPSACGEYRTQEEFVPWAGGPPLRSSVPMRIDEGCNTGGFDPKLDAGTTEPIGGRFSPFLFTLTRTDAEQNPAAIEVALPEGLAASFRGIPRCEGAAALSGDCPPASRIGKVLAAVGAGPFPLWVPQAAKEPTAVYLAGPYKGAPFSTVAVVPAQAGPFDLGDQVVRSALFVNPRTAQGMVRSDPLPQIIQGIPVRYRTIQVELDRPNFTLNPTGCQRKEVTSTITSAQGALAHPSAPFQAANCALLDFKPRLSLELSGGTRRAQHPALHAAVKPRAGDANIAQTVVRLPRSAFLDQAHIRTICTRVQFASDSCPAASVYGHVVARTPLLEETLEGPAYLRSSNHNLPDLVFALHGVVDVEAVGRIDSIKGGIRASFEDIPDVPITEVAIEMQGGSKGLIVNSRNLCSVSNRAHVSFTAQNGKGHAARPLVRAGCKRAQAKKHRHKGR